MPGTGLWYTEKLGEKKGRSHSSGGSRREFLAPTAAVPPEERLTLGFFKRLFTPQEEEDLVDGMREVVLGDPEKAYSFFVKAAHLADAAFMAGMMALKLNRLNLAEGHLRRALEMSASLGEHFHKYELTITIDLPITERVCAQIAPKPRGIRLALAEIHQTQGRWEEAASDLRELQAEHPEDLIIILSLCEILVEEFGDAEACHEVVKLAEGIENESEIEAAILLWKGKALRILGLSRAARDVLSSAFRRKRDRSDKLLQAIRYERILAYEALGNTARVRAELENLYAEAPNCEDVAARLGFS